MGNVACDAPLDYVMYVTLSCVKIPNFQNPELLKFNH